MYQDKTRQQTRKSALSVRFAEGITQVHVPATDLESAVVWYVTHLGCDLVDYQPQHALLRVPGGPHLLLWVTAAAALAPMMVNGGHCAALRLQARDLAALRDYLLVARSEMQQQVDQATGRQILKLRDPSGNLLVIEQDPTVDVWSSTPATAMPATMAVCRR
jgi:catechol-2,3-dioxygenase